MCRSREKSMEMRQGNWRSISFPAIVHACAQSNTNGPGDCGPVAVQVIVIPKTVIVSEPPYVSRLSPEATVPLSGPTVTGSPAAIAGFFVPVKAVVPPVAGRCADGAPGAGGCGHTA